MFLRSHIWITGEESSSEAVTICVASTGFHPIALHLLDRKYYDDKKTNVVVELSCLCLLLGSLKVMTGLFALRSQTTDTPLNEVEARMYQKLRRRQLQNMCRSTLWKAVNIKRICAELFCSTLRK